MLDVGCGDGKITAHIASSLSNGSVHGIDFSQEMIAFAQAKFKQEQYPNLSFSRQDAQDLQYAESFDLIFSSFALQWLPSPANFFAGAKNSLRSTGHLALTIPLCISSSLEYAVKKITSLPEWRAYFQNFDPGWHFTTEVEYAELLARHEFLPKHLSKKIQVENFPSRKMLEKYIQPWFSYLSALPEDLQELFFTQVIDNYMAVEALDTHGNVPFRFSRIDIIARKATL